MENFIEQHKAKILGHLSCYDRLLFQGNLHSVCWADGMASHLLRKKIRVFDYPAYTNGI